MTDLAAWWSYIDLVLLIPAEGGFRGDRAAIAVAAVLYGVGIGLLAAGVWVDLPGPLAAYSDPTASWPIWVQVGLAAVALLTWRQVSHHRNRAFTLVLLGLGVACVFVLGIAAYSRCPQPGQSPFWGVVSRVLGLVLNDYKTDEFSRDTGCDLDGAPLALQVAHLAQLAVLLVAATSAMRALLRGQLDRLVVRISRRVFLVLAVDSSASTLLPALSVGAHDSTRATITKDPAAPWLLPARLAGWRIVTGDPDDPALLRTLLRRPGGSHALTGLAVLSSDPVHTQQLMHAVDNSIRHLRGSAPVCALLRVDDAWQAEDWRRRYLGQPGRWIVDTISEFEVTARLLALDAHSRGLRTLILAGNSGLTFALLAEVAQQIREGTLVEDAAAQRIILVDPSAELVWDEHQLAQRSFGMETQVTARVREDHSVEQVLEELTDTSRTAVIFTGDPDTESQRLASRLGILHPDVVVYSRRTEVNGVGTTPLLAQVIAYGATLDAGDGRPIDRWERLARLAHAAYVQAHPDPGNPARLPWDGGLSEFHRASNVRQIMTTLGAAVEVGRSWSTSTMPADQVSPPSEEQLERMAQIEHDSWRRQQAEHSRRHADLVPWGQLGLDSRVKTRDGVIESLRLLATLGYRSFDDPDAQWRRFRRSGEVTAAQRDEDWEWTSASGDAMRGLAGDWEVVDAGGPRSVSAQSFLHSYEHVEGDRYRRVGAVEARRAVPGELVASPEGSATAVPGHWLVRNPATSEEWLVPDAHFRASYVAEGNSKPPVGS